MNITLPRAVVQATLDALKSATVWHSKNLHDVCRPMYLDAADSLRAALAGPMTDGEYKQVGEQIKAKKLPVHVAYLHTVVGDDGEPDQALSFERDSFPLQGAGGFRSVGCRPLVFGDAQPQAEPASDVADIIAGALQTSRAHAYELMADAVREAQPATQPTPAPAGEPVAYTNKAAELADELLSLYSGKGGVILRAAEELKRLGHSCESYRHSYDGYGWLYLDNGHGSNWQERAKQYPDAEPLYTTPQPRKPLTDEQIVDISMATEPTDDPSDEWELAFARAIERAITGGQS